MEHNNYFFYLVVALSVVGSIVKALKKKPVEQERPRLLPFVPGTLKRVISLLRQKSDTPLPLLLPRIRYLSPLRSMWMK